MIERRDTGPAWLDKTSRDEDEFRLGGHVWFWQGTHRLVWLGPKVPRPDPETVTENRQRIQEAMNKAPKESE